MIEGEHKACLYCGEQILAVAVRCKHCGSDVGGERVVAAEQPADYGIALITIPIAGALLLWFWVGNMLLIQSPGAYGWLVVISAIGGTAVLATIEDGKARGSQDFKWLVSLALVWLIAYPAYLRKRAEHGLSDLMVPGICAAAALITSAFLVQNAIANAERVAAGDLAAFSASMEQLQTESSQNAATMNSATEGEDSSGDGGVASNDEPGAAVDTSNITAVNVGSDTSPVISAVVGDAAPTAPLPTGKFSSENDVLLWIEPRQDGDAVIRVLAGSVGADACEEGVVDCLKLSGVAVPAGPNYEVADPAADCTFRLRSEGVNVVLSDVEGICGTGTANRYQLAAIAGTFTAVMPIQPSFSCTQAGTAVEQAICANPELGRLDQKLAQVYKAAREGAADPARIQAQQRTWLQSRNACGTDACLLASYQARLGELGAAR